MKEYIIKKHVFAILFLSVLICFSGWNAYSQRDVLTELGKEALRVQNVQDLKEWILRFEASTNETITGRMGFVETYGMIQKVMGKREFNNFSFIRDDDGMMYYGAIAMGEKRGMEEYADRVKRAMDTANEKGARTLFVLTPSKIINGVSYLNPDWPVNDTNGAQDEILSLLGERGVPTVDLRGVIQRSGKKHEELFFKTDHHWTAEAAFLAAEEITEKVREYFGDDWDPDRFYCDRAQYNSYTYENVSLGSMGKNTGVVYSGRDSLTLLWPKFHTDMTWIDREHDKEQSGTFAEAFFDHSSMRSKGVYNGPGIRAYLNLSVNQDTIINHENPEGPRILCLRDSYMSPLACFLAPMASRIDMVWARRNQNSLDYEKMVREGGYDYLIIEVYPHNLDEDAFDYFKE